MQATTGRKRFTLQQVTPPFWSKIRTQIGLTLNIDTSSPIYKGREWNYLVLGVVIIVNSCLLILI